MSNKSFFNLGFISVCNNLYQEENYKDIHSLAKQFPEKFADKSNYHYFFNKLKKNKYSITSLVGATLLAFSLINTPSTQHPILESNHIHDISISKPSIGTGDVYHIEYNNQLLNEENKLQSFVDLLSMTEGRSKKFYKDNNGIAIAYGWNPTQNSEDFNLEIALLLDMSDDEIDNILSISNTNSIQEVPDFFKDFELTDEQLEMSAEILMKEYEKEFLNVLTIKARNSNLDSNSLRSAYHSLDNSQKSVLIHMAYKLGAGNLSKYNEFFTHFIEYLENPNQLSLEKISDNFQYSYRDRNGVIKRDSSVEKKHTAFFNFCQDSINSMRDDVVDISYANQCSTTIKTRIIP